MIGLVLVEILLFAQQSGDLAHSSSDRTQRTESSLIGSVIASEEDLLSQPLEHWIKIAQTLKNRRPITYVVFHVASESFVGGAREFDGSTYERWVQDYVRRRDMFQKPRVEVLMTPGAGRVRRLIQGRIEEMSALSQELQPTDFERLLLRSLELATVVPSQGPQPTVILFLTVSNLETSASAVIAAKPLLTGGMIVVMRRDSCFGGNTYYPRANPFVRSIQSCPPRSVSLPNGYVCYVGSGEIVCSSRGGA